MIFQDGLGRRVGDELSLKMELNRLSLGAGRISWKPDRLETGKVPFTLGPISGYATVNELPGLTGWVGPGICFEMEIHLHPDREVSIAQVLRAFYPGIEIVENK